MKNKRWTYREDCIIMTAYEDNLHIDEVMEMLPDRTKGAIYSRASKLDCRFTRWSKEDIKIVKKYYATTPIKKIYEMIGHRHKIEAIYHKASKLGLKRTNFHWSDEELEILYNKYPVEGYDCFKMINRNFYSIRHKIYKLGIRKRQARRTEWNNEDDEILKKYLIEGYKISSRLPTHSVYSIIKRVEKLGLIDNIKWSIEEEDVLKCYFPTEGRSVINRLSNQNDFTIEAKAIELKVKSYIPWTCGEIKILEEKYPLIGDKVILDLDNKTISSIKNMAHRLNLLIK